jgi:IS30 family transposase
MKEITDRKHKHLTFDDRLIIQEKLSQESTFKAIAIELDKDPSTISKEIRRHIRTTELTYIKKDSKGNIINDICSKLIKAPYVCNGCLKRRRCRLQKRLYEAKFAQQEYESLLREAREGIPLSKESFYEIDKVISAGIEKGQHIYHIVTTNDLPISVSTVYRHMDKGYLSKGPLDLPRKVKFKARKPKDAVYVPRGIRIGRTYEDFLSFTKDNEISHWMEMDTLIGEVGGKVIMTWNFNFCNFMVGFLLESKAASCVANTFEEIKGKFEEHNLSFGNIVPVILTDNGGEFSNADAIECNLSGIKETSLFFCRPMRASDKPHIEKNHTLFRDVCPKGTSFNNFTQEDVNLIFSHVNSASRKLLNGKTPYEIFEFTYGEKITSLFGIKKIPSGEVTQSPLLLKKLKGNTQ